MEKKELTKSAAKEKALRLLEFRSHTKKELRDKLIRAGANADDLPEIFDFLTEYKLINDEDYAKRYAKDLQNLKKYGRRRIIDELRSKGISSEYIESAMSELSKEEEDTLFLLVLKKLNGIFEQKNIDKTIRYFIYRGYEFGDIKACIEKAKLQAEE